MAIRDDLISVEDTARALDVSVQHVRRLADSGRLSKVVRGQLDRLSVERYRFEHPRSRTRAWAEATAWGAIAMLNGQDADWLGASQASRLRQHLREITEVDDLLTRMRDRALVRTFVAHRAAVPRLRDVVAVTDTRSLGITDAMDGSIDGYLASNDLDDVVRSLVLRAGPDGAVTLRVTNFDFDRVRTLVNTSVVAALDTATSVDPRLRGVGRRALAELLETYR